MLYHLTSTERCISRKIWDTGAYKSWGWVWDDVLFFLYDCSFTIPNDKETYDNVFCIIEMLYIQSVVVPHLV